MRPPRAPSRGIPNGRVAEELGLAPSTVKRHLANVYRKMGVGPRARRWISPDEVTPANEGGGTYDG